MPIFLTGKYGSHSGLGNAEIEASIQVGVHLPPFFSCQSGRGVDTTVHLCLGAVSIPVPVVLLRPVPGLVTGHVAYSVLAPIARERPLTVVLRLHPSTDH